MADQYGATCIIKLLTKSNRDCRVANIYITQKLKIWNLALFEVKLQKDVIYRNISTFMSVIPFSVWSLEFHCLNSLKGTIISSSFSIPERVLSSHVIIDCWALSSQCQHSTLTYHIKQFTMDIPIKNKWT